ncbi:hypothetical protein PR202_gb11664 [Eleusine coracana subsp. coracana]|uniref:Uncharacterized protein n=1 Tax=Eleusine coracana subsp. coracana TaxID=191504 RepID=A0AAV5ENI7_ELECO|nr:hypothetical protein PR202_gb11664 [Eleusine coracana subsp. coracana]
MAAAQARRTRSLQPQRLRGSRPVCGNMTGTLMNADRGVACSASDAPGDQDTVAPLLVPCYDLATATPFMFSRADAIKTDSLRLPPPRRLRRVGAREVCRSHHVHHCGVGRSGSHGQPRCRGHYARAPQQAGIPLASGVEDVMLLAIGTGASSSSATRSLARITAEGVADMVDESVGMACGSNYVRV